VIAAGLLWWLARNISVASVGAAFARANWWLLLGACALSVSCWVIGEALLYSRLISYFHRWTSFREMLPINAAQEFLQIVNKAAAGISLVVYMHRCKDVPWMSGGGTLIFMAFIDLLVIGMIAVLAALIAPAALLGMPRWLPALLLGGLIAAAIVIRYGSAATPTGRWLGARPSLATFRRARAWHYGRLMALRAPTFLAQTLVLYLELRSFGLHAPLGYVFSFIPALTFLSSLPIAPGGIGPRQAATVLGLAAFGSKADLLAMSLAHSFGSILFRIPLVLFTATYMRRVFPAQAARDANQALAVR
jgi:uncharacterized membrane protein YbhN (UPF0104 family)